MSIYRVDLKMSVASRGNAVSVYHFEVPGTQPGDSTLLSAAEDWLTAILTPWETRCSTAVVFAGCQLSEVDNTGTTVRLVGNLSPDWAPTQTTDLLPPTVAGSINLRTNTPKVRGAKRIVGFCEDRQSQGLVTSDILTVLGGMALAILLGPEGFGLPEAVAGVVSSKVLDFVPFNGTGSVTNILGTQTTRKPLRGS